jgi:hypothetical protein
MLHVKDVIGRPVEVVSDVSYLLVDLVQGVAYDSPSATPISTS